ncbi:hypothetical protein, partial [Streptococcus pyogenes]|uniref:hypothetical protein n=1 Tax=Streptococcus pyogenes TaxID=1314 RepID=UPI001652F446
ERRALERGGGKGRREERDLSWEGKKNWRYNRGDSKGEGTVIMKRGGKTWGGKGGEEKGKKEKGEEEITGRGGERGETKEKRGEEKRS